MDQTATLICHRERISWTVYHAGQKFTGANTLQYTGGGDYLVLQTNVVNELQERFGCLDFDFIRGA